VGAVRDWITAMEAQRLAPNTVRGYSSDVSHALSWLESQGHARLEDITTASLRSWLVSSRENSARTTRRWQASLRAFFRWAVEDGLLLTDPAKRLRPVRVPKTLPKYLTPAQVRTLLDAVPLSNPFRERDYALILWLFETGCRIGETLNLQLSALDLSTRSARMMGKGSKERLVAFGDATATALGRWIEARDRHLEQHGLADAGWVFATRSGNGIQHSAWDKALKCYARKAKLPFTVSSHMLRHSFATALWEGGIDPFVLRDLMGHASLDSTAIYTHVSDARRRAAYDATFPQL